MIRQTYLKGTPWGTLLASILFLGGGPLDKVWASGPELWLITPEEAAMANAPPEVLERGRLFDIGREGLDTGPLISVLKPSLEEALSPPIEVAVKFAARHAPIDLSSLKVTVVKFFSFDITDRVLPFIKPDGIQIPDAQLPSGEHTVRISLADAEGGVSSKQVTIKVR